MSVLEYTRIYGDCKTKNIVYVNVTYKNYVM